MPYSLNDPYLLWKINPDGEKFITEEQGGYNTDDFETVNDDETIDTPSLESYPSPAVSSISVSSWDESNNKPRPWSAPAAASALTPPLQQHRPNHPKVEKTARPNTRLEAVFRYLEFIQEEPNIINLIKAEWQKSGGDVNDINNQLIQLFRETNHIHDKDSRKIETFELLKIFLDIIKDPDYKRNVIRNREKDILNMIPKHWIQRYYELAMEEERKRKRRPALKIQNFASGLKKHRKSKKRKSKKPRKSKKRRKSKKTRKSKKPRKSKKRKTNLK